MPSMIIRANNSGISKTNPIVISGIPIKAPIPVAEIKKPIKIAIKPVILDKVNASYIYNAQSLDFFIHIKVVAWIHDE